MLLSPSVLKMVEREIPMQIKQNVFISNELDEILRDTVETGGGLVWLGQRGRGLARCVCIHD